RVTLLRTCCHPRADRRAFPTRRSSDLLNMSSLGFAYLGDAVYEVMVRAWLCLHGKLTPGRQHKAALAYVAAPRQAALLERILPLDRKSTRLNSSHVSTAYAVFCLKKKT